MLVCSLKNVHKLIYSLSKICVKNQYILTDDQYFKKLYILLGNITLDAFVLKTWNFVLNALFNLVHAQVIEILFTLCFRKSHQISESVYYFRGNICSSTIVFKRLGSTRVRELSTFQSQTLLALFSIFSQLDQTFFRYAHSWQIN